MKTPVSGIDAPFVQSIHPVGTFMPETTLSAWMSASSFAGNKSPRCAFTLTRNIASPAVVLFRSSSIASSEMFASGILLLTPLFCHHITIFLQLSAA